MARAAFVRNAGGFPRRLLRRAATPPQCPKATARRPPRGGPGRPPRTQAPLPPPPPPRRVGGPRSRLLCQHRRQDHATGRACREDREEVPLPHHGLRPRPAGGGEPPRPPV